MPKNKGKGGKNRRRGKNEKETEKQDLLYKEEGQEYAQVLQMLGNGRLNAYCFDGVKRLCHIRGKLRKRVWINTGDIILVSLRDFQDEKADVIGKYDADEAKALKAQNLLPDNINVNDGDMQDDAERGGNNIEFMSESSSSDKDENVSDVDIDDL